MGLGKKIERCVTYVLLDIGRRNQRPNLAIWSCHLELTSQHLSCSFSVSLRFLPTVCPRTHTHISTHALTDRPRLGAVSVELWWPLCGSEAGGDRPGTLFHRDMSALLFLHAGQNFGVIPPHLCRKYEIGLFESFLKIKERTAEILDLQIRYYAGVIPQRDVVTSVHEMMNADVDQSDRIRLQRIHFVLKCFHVW